jgi:hypothetical protein
MDGTNISDYARSEAFTRYGTNPVDEGNTLFGLTSHPDGTNTLTTDGNGEISGSFIVPNNDGLRFRVGDRQIKFLDISVDKEENAGCIARSTYSAKGFLDTKQATYTSTRQLNVQGFYSPPPVYYNSGDGGGGGHDPDPKGNPHGTIDDHAVSIGNGFTSNTTSGYDDQGPPSGYGGDPSGGGGGSDAGESEGTYICTQLYGMNAINTNIFKVMRKYGIGLRRTDPYMMKGYDIIGPWYSSLFGKHKKMTKYGIWLSKYYKDVMENNKLSFTQKAHEVVLAKMLARPLYRTIGFISEMIKRVK